MTQFAPTRELLDMLTYARPHGSKVEAMFVTRFINTLPGVYYDKFGNAVVRIGTAPILWSSHTDTVAAKQGKQKVVVSDGVVSLADQTKKGSVLGGDDSAGVWLMCEMIRAERPGLYIFHAGEECGGLGSGWIAKHNPKVLEGIKYAIALDRKGTNSVITHQGGRSASDSFAKAVATQLNSYSKNFRFKLDTTGTFTDTANYVDLIGECSNLSVGYEDAHSPFETLDADYLIQLRNALLVFDCSDLPAVRKPGEDDDYLPDYRFGSKMGAIVEDVYDEALVELCREYPDVAAKLISSMGYNAEDLKHAIWMEGYDV